MGKGERAGWACRPGRAIEGFAFFFIFLFSVAFKINAYTFYLNALGVSKLGVYHM